MIFNLVHEVFLYFFFKKILLNKSLGQMKHIKTKTRKTFTHNMYTQTISPLESLYLAISHYKVRCN